MVVSIIIGIEIDSLRQCSVFVYEWLTIRILDVFKHFCFSSLKGFIIRS